MRRISPRRRLLVAPLLLALTLGAHPAAAAPVSTCGDGVLDAGESCDDGNQLAGDGCDGACRVEAARFDWWNPRFALPGTYHGPPLVTPAGIVVVLDTGFEDSQAQLFDPDTGALLSTFPELTASYVAGFDGDIWIADVGAPGVVHRYNGTTLMLEQSYPNPDPSGLDGFGRALGRVGTLVLVQNGRTHTVDVFDAATGAFQRSLVLPSGTTDQNFGAEIVAVGAHVGLAGSAAAYLYDPGTGAFIATLDGAPEYIFGLVHPVAVGDDVLVRATDGTVSVFDGATGALLDTISPPAGSDPLFGRYIRVIADALLISGSAVVHVFDPTTRAFRRTITEPSQDGCGFGGTMLDTPFGLAISDRCFGDDFNGIVYLFDHADDRLLAALPNLHGGSNLRMHTRTLGTYGTTLLVAQEEDHSPGVILAYRPCADGVLAPGEECDDGNLTSGDGCDLSCTVTRCGNGIVTAGEECDDGNRIGSDGCESGCTLTVDVCAEPTRMTGARLALRHLGAPPGDETLVLEGRLVPAPGVAFDPLDVSLHGAQVRVADAAGLPLLDLSLSTTPIPPGPRGSGCGTHDGWRVRDDRAVYTNGSGALGPGCVPGSAQGLHRLDLKQRAGDGGVTFRFRVGPTAIDDPASPLVMTIALAGASGPAATCGIERFPTSQCARTASGGALLCH